ncbi:MAG: glycosyltransferase [Pyrinomonadaceae bacterium]|nr:glycosyltransferase [Pyrinomonadaceae bacterium]MBP6212201.1 glycosyltransferase [Pyrinomonadaceae bacterium]
MLWLFMFFAVVLVWFSFRSLHGGFAYLRFFRERLSDEPSVHTPFATIIAPCRGIDPDMSDNLRALFEQEYPAYEIIFVVDDAADASVAVINELMGRNRRIPAKLVIAPKSTTSSQKVENLREAVLHANPASEIFAFVDSDARPTQTWLRSLAAPLVDENIGAATGYRWFISPQPTMASELRSVWNASVASSLGPNTTSNFCWGGSMAMRRDVFDRVAMRDKWHGTLSDDFVVTKALNDAGMPIVFVPSAMAASVENCTFRELLEFTTRQMKITRVYQTKLWVLSFFGSGLFCVVMTAAFLIVLLSRTNGIAVWSAIATIALISAFSIGKAWLRLRAIRLALPQYEPALSRQTLAQLTLWLVTSAIFLYNAAAALVSRRMTWRGIRYELKSPTETVIITE